MGETQNIAEMARHASDVIFSVFGWDSQSLENHSWDCVEQKKHHKIKGSKTHPTDVVFRYIDPYSGETVYVNTDLKSFAKNTLDTTDLVKTIKSLGHATECANKSSEWKKLFVDVNLNHSVIGLLFIYNHDGGYDSDFEKRLMGIAPSQAQLDPEYKIGIMGPQRVLYLNTIAADIKSLLHDGLLPEKTAWNFYYPHLNRRKSLITHSKSATLWTLLSPIIVIAYEFPDGSAKAIKRGYHVYYDGKGDSPDEFQYVFDYCFRYQMATESTEVHINLVNHVDDAKTQFQKALREYSTEYWKNVSDSKTSFERIVKGIQYREVQQRISQFGKVDLGMKVR